jgi:hypothetical protein
VRVTAILASYNEHRFLAGCLEHLVRQGVDAYLIDNGSTDGTVALAERYRGRGLVGLEHFPRAGVFDWEAILARKDQLAATLDTDWVMHVDPDEIHLPPRSDTTLAETLAEIDAAGYNAIDTQEFSFIPTRESPDHDHPDFQRTMRWYYPFRPRSPFAMRAWKRRSEGVELAAEGGHSVAFPGLRLYPQLFRVRHYVFLSVEHAIRKYVTKRYAPDAVARGWHEWRASLSPEMIVLPSERTLRRYTSDADLDATSPRRRHVLAEGWLARQTGAS